MKRFMAWMFAAVMAVLSQAASAAEIPLGAGDVLKISVYNNPDLTLETRVSDSGSITFPLVGMLTVGGLSPSMAEIKLAQLLEKGGFLKKPQVNIIVTSMQSQQVSVLGQVNRPGRYPIDGKRSLLDFLALAGGIGADGGDVVSLIRKRDGVAKKDTIDVIQMVRSGELSQDYEVAGNDIIYVERAPRFYIYGEVQRPGMFRLERNMTVVQALSAGGGLTPRGTERGIRVKRRGADGKMEVIEVSHDTLLQADDVVYIKESLF